MALLRTHSRSPRRVRARGRGFTVAVLIAALAAALAVEGLAPAQASADPAGDWLSLVNQARASAGVGPVSLDPTLMGQSGIHSNFMASTGRFCHSTDCDPAGGPVQNGTWSSWGENVGWTSDCNVVTLHNALMNSPGHRANIMNPSFTRLGVAWVQGRSPDPNYGSVCYVTEQFTAAAAAPAPPAAGAGRGVQSATRTVCRGKGRKRRCRTVRAKARKGKARQARRARRPRKARRR